MGRGCSSFASGPDDSGNITLLMTALSVQPCGFGPLGWSREGESEQEAPVSLGRARIRTPSHPPPSPPRLCAPNPCRVVGGQECTFGVRPTWVGPGYAIFKPWCEANYFYSLYPSFLICNKGYIIIPDPLFPYLTEKLFQKSALIMSPSG